MHYRRGSFFFILYEGCSPRTSTFVKHALLSASRMQKSVMTVAPSTSADNRTLNYIWSKSVVGNCAIALQCPFSVPLTQMMPVVMLVSRFGFCAGSATLRYSNVSTCYDGGDDWWVKCGSRLLCQRRRVWFREWTDCFWRSCAAYQLTSRLQDFPRRRRQRRHLT